MLLLAGFALANAVENAPFLLSNVGEGQVHALLFEDASHFAEDGGGIGTAFEFGEALGEFINARTAGLVSVERGLAEFLALGRFGVLCLREVAVTFALGAEEDLFAEAGGGDLRADFDDFNGFVLRSFHPPLRAQDEGGEEDDRGDEEFDRGDAPEDGALPGGEFLAQRGEFVVQALDGEFEGEGALGSVTEVLLDFGALEVVALKLAALGLEPGGVGVLFVNVPIRMSGNIELVRHGVAMAARTGLDQPGLLALLQRVEEFKLRVGAAAKFGVGLRRLRPIGVADDLDESLATVNFAPEHVAQIPVFGAEDVHHLRLEALASQNGVNALACATQFARDGGDENTRLVHAGQYGRCYKLRRSKSLSTCSASSGSRPTKFAFGQGRLPRRARSSVSKRSRYATCSVSYCNPHPGSCRGPHAATRGIGCGSAGASRPSNGGAARHPPARRGLPVSRTRATQHPDPRGRVRVRAGTIPPIPSGRHRCAGRCGRGRR